MCRWLNITRSSYSYKAVEIVSEAELEEKFKKVFLENNAPILNHLARKFNQQKLIMTDLTNGKRWTYVCFMIGLFNSGILDMSVGRHKIDDLVKNAIQSIPYDLTKV